MLCTVLPFFGFPESHYAYFKVCACVGTHRYRGYQGVGGQVLLEIAWLLPKRPHARIMQGPKGAPESIQPLMLLTSQYRRANLLCNCFSSFICIFGGGGITENGSHTLVLEKKKVNEDKGTEFLWINMFINHAAFVHTKTNCNHITDQHFHLVTFFSLGRAHETAMFHINV